MAIKFSDAFTDIGLASTSGRTLDNTLGGSDAKTWTFSTAAFAGNNADAVISNSASACNLVSAGSGSGRFRVRVNPNAATSNLVLHARRVSNSSASIDSVSVILVSPYTSFRVREFTAGATADRATATITSPGNVPFWLEIEVNGLVVTGRILNEDTSVRNTVTHTFAALPAGDLWGFGFLQSGTASIFDSATFDDLAASDTTAPTFTGSITVGAKTSSTIVLTLPTASDNVSVTGYEYRVNGGSWIDNGNSTAISLTGLTSLTSYTVDARAYDASANKSTTLSVTTSTYRAGALGSTILLTTGPVDGNPAGILYNDVESGDEGKWFSFYIVTDVASGTLDIDPDGTFEFTGPSATFFTYQLEIDGVAVGSPATVYLYSSGGGGGIISGDTINEKLMSHFGASGAFADAERSWLISQVGSSSLSNNDLWYVFLKSQGYTGSLQDMKSAYLLSIL